MNAPEEIWIDEDTWYAGPGRTDRAVRYIRADLCDAPETGGCGVNAPEWKHMTDWSDLPDVYVTKVECQKGMFWRVEACSVPMAIGPECRLVRADLYDAQAAEIADLRRQLAEARDKALEEAALVAEPKSKVKQKLGKWVTGANEQSAASISVRKQIAAAIRALKGAAK